MPSPLQFLELLKLLPALQQQGPGGTPPFVPQDSQQQDAGDFFGQLLSGAQPAPQPDQQQQDVGQFFGQLLGQTGQAAAPPESGGGGGLLRKLAGGLQGIGRGVEDFNQARIGDERQSSGVLGGIGRALIPALQIAGGIALRDAPTTAQRDFNQQVQRGSEFRQSLAQRRRESATSQSLAEARLRQQDAALQVRVAQLRASLARLDAQQLKDLRKAVLDDFTNAGFSGDDFDSLYGAPEMQALIKATGLSKSVLKGAFKAGPSKLSKRATLGQEVQELRDLGIEPTEAEVKKKGGFSTSQGSQSKLQQFEEFSAEMQKRHGREPTTRETLEFFKALPPEPRSLSFNQKMDQLPPGQARLDFLRQSDPKFFAGLDEAQLRSYEATGRPQLDKVSGSELLSTMELVRLAVGDADFEGMELGERFERVHNVLSAGRMGSTPRVETTQVPRKILGYDLPFTREKTDILPPEGRVGQQRPMTQEALDLFLQTLPVGAAAPDLIAPMLDGLAQGNDVISDKESGIEYRKVNGKWVRQ